MKKIYRYNYDYERWIYIGINGDFQSNPALLKDYTRMTPGDILLAFKVSLNKKA